MYKISKLQNGLNLITIPLKGTKATTVLVLLPVGSRYETKKISGVSHFVEHMMFKGTAKRPTALDITRELESVGAEFNAFTGKEYTGYYVKIDGTKQELAFDLLSDMLFNSRMDEAEMTKEKGVIVEELHMYEDNPTMFINLMFDRLLFGDCPLGWDEGGSASSVNGLNREELNDYYKSAYEPQNMILVVAGAIDQKKLKKLVEKYYAQQKNFKAGRLRPDGLRRAEKKRTKNSFEKFVFPKTKIKLVDRVMVQERKVDQAHMILGFPGLDHNHPKRHALGLMTHILGGGMSSRLFMEVREKRGLAYMVHSANGSFRDIGMNYVRAGLDPARLLEALQVIKAELQKMATAGVTGRELRDAKSNISGRLALSMEESNAQAEWYAKQFWFMKKIETPEAVLKKIKKVTAKEVQAIAKEIFAFDLMRLAVIGPVKKEEVMKMLNGQMVKLPV